MKNKLLLLMVFLYFIDVSNAQNLVPNGSFETKDPSLGCPYPDSFSNGKPQYWIGYTSPATPVSYDLSGDYFNPCAPNNNQSNYPGSNEAGCVLPLDGQSYCGFLAFAANYAAPAQESEYIMNSNIPLNAGQQYYVEFYVFNAQGNNSLFPSTAYSKRIGAYFILNANNLSAGQTNGLNTLIPQIPNTFPSQSYYNASGWQKISGNFTPTVSGNWTMVIGNFDPGMNNVTANPCTNNPKDPEANPDLGGLKSGTRCNGQNIASYYYVDAVTVIPTGQTSPSYSPYITGNGLVCSNPSSTYTLQNIPFGATASWSVTPTNLFSSATSGTGASASLTAASGAIGTAILSYALTSACSINQPSAQTTIHVGPPSADITTLIYLSNSRGVNPVSLHPAATYNFRCDPVVAATSFTWVLPNGFSFYSYA